MTTHGVSGEEQYRVMKSTIDALRRDLLLAQSERDGARQDNTRLAAWLKKHHPEVFRQYFTRPE